MILKAKDHPPEPLEDSVRAWLGPISGVGLSDLGGLTQFGVFLDRLNPGARSSDRHWHENEDEFLYVLQGTPTLVDDDGAHDLAPGDACTWKAGHANAHHVVNRSTAPCLYLIVGTRAETDKVHYADIDKLYIRDADGTEHHLKRDGTPYVAANEGD